MKVFWLKQIVARFLFQALFLQIVCLNVSHTQPGTEFTYSLLNGWNMVSLPLHLSDTRVSAIFPFSNGIVYSYNNAPGYKTVDTMEVGIGYWIKSKDATSPRIFGDELLEDTIVVSLGWNMIGSLTAPIPKVSLKRIPSGIILGNIFGLDCGYAGCDTMLRPGMAYWLKASQDGKVILRVP